MSRQIVLPVELDVIEREGKAQVEIWAILHKFDSNSRRRILRNVDSYVDQDNHAANGEDY